MRQRQKCDKAETWACPACAGLNDAQKKTAENVGLEQSSKKSLGCPPESRRKQRNLEESGWLVSSLTADSALSNLERQGFEKPVAIDIWKQKLDAEQGLQGKKASVKTFDAELRNKTFNMHPTNPQVDIRL
eukprot:1147846-Pelagomonas_calceolata.AAC.3